MNDYGFKLIHPQLTQAMLDEDDDTMAIVSLCTGMNVSRGTAPLIGRYMRMGNQLVSDRIPSHPHLVFGFNWGVGEDEGRLVALYIGSPFHGPLLVWTRAGWSNVYGAGDHGDNPASGGTWHVDPGVVHPTLRNAIAARNFRVEGKYMTKAGFTEGPELVRCLNEIAATE